MTESSSDRELVEAVQTEGSERAFRQLFKRHSPRMYRVGIRITGDVQEAEDVLQESWLRAVEHLHGFHWRSTFSTWITGIAANVSREVLRRRGRWPTEELTSAHAAGVAPLDLHRIDLERAVASLTPRQRATFILHDVEGFTHEEVAKHLSCSPGTSKSQLHRARRELARYLKGARKEAKEAENE